MTDDDMKEVRLRIRLPQWVVDRLQKMADEERTMISKVIERVVCKHLAKETP